jgi:hypothetical protein
LFILASAVALLAGCESYPPAHEVATCAAARIGTEHGSFKVTERPGSMFSTTEYTITYQKAGGPDRAVVVYYQRKGPVTTQVEISTAIMRRSPARVDAIKYCAQTSLKQSEQEGPRNPPAKIDPRRRPLSVGIKKGSLTLHLRSQRCPSIAAVE